MVVRFLVLGIVDHRAVGLLWQLPELVSDGSSGGEPLGLLYPARGSGAVPACC